MNADSDLVIQKQSENNQLVLDVSGRIGVNTDAPTERLDVNGRARVRNIPAGVAADAIVTTDANGNLRQRTAAEIVAAGGGVTTNDGDAWGVTGEDIASNISRTGAVTINNGSTSALTIQTPDNTLSNGIAFQNSGAAFTWNMFRADAGSNNADLVFAGGQLNNDVSLLDERMRISSNGNVGIGSGATPSAKLDVNGNARVRTIPASADTDQLVTADADGNLRKVNSLKASKVFYPPSIEIDASVTGTFTVDLYAQYIAQFGSPVVSSGGTIPTYGSGDLDYHVTYADPAVFNTATMAISPAGVLTYTVDALPSDYNTLINVVFVVK
jgi:hypothetical protein